MRTKHPYHARSHLPGGSDPLQESVYGFGATVNGQPDTITVPSGSSATQVTFGTLCVEQGVVAHRAPDPLGFTLPQGVWHISAQAHWGNVETGYQRQAYLQGLTFSYLTATVDMDMETSDIIPDNSNAYLNKIATIFRQNEPNPALAPIVVLAVIQNSGGDIELQSATLTCLKLRGL